MDAIDLSLFALVCICTSVFICSFITSVTGMAGGVLLFSAMAIFIPFKPLIAIHGAVQVVNNGVRSWMLLNHIKKSMCVYFAFGAILGTISVTYLLRNYTGQILPLSILAILIIYSLFKPQKLPELKLPPILFIFVGFLTGSLGMLAGAIDPLLAIFFMRDDLTKEQIVANKSMMQLICHALKIPAFLYLGFSFIDNLWLIALFSAFAIAGTKVGVMVLYKINQSIFMKIMWWALFFSGAYIIYKIYLLVI